MGKLSTALELAITQILVTPINGISTFTKLIFCQKNAENNF